MIKNLTFESLLQETLIVSNIECHRQIWTEGREWLGYEKNPRYADGLLLFKSDIVGEFYVGGRKIISASKGDAVYIPKDSLYRLKFKNGGKNPDIFTVNFILTDAEGNTLRMADALTLFPAAASRTVLDIASELNNAFLFSQSALKKQSLLLSLLDSFSSFFGTSSKSYYVIQKGVDLMLKEWNKNEKIARYANLCDISESSFYDHFKKWSGQSPNEYKNKIRINNAKSMLKNTNLQISEIAFHVGYEDPYYFSRLFKKLVGVSPREFRNN